MATGSNSPDPKDILTQGEGNTASAPNDVKGKAQELASAVVGKAGDLAADVSHKAQDWAGNVANKAQETAAAVVQKADGGIANVGQQMNALGGKVRGTVAPGGAIDSAASAVANELEAGGRYLEGHGLEAISKDLTDMVKQYPVQSLLIGFGVGCLFGMAFSRRS